MEKEFLVLYYKADSDEVIKDIEKIEAKNIKEAYDLTENNLTSNIVIPLNKENLNKIKEIAN